jgi:transposase InsO family protein
VSDKFEFIDGQKYAYPIVKMCSWLEVSRSGFYEWRDRPTSATVERRETLKIHIAGIFADSDETYGYRRVHAQLAREGIEAGPELVRGLMRELGLVACQPRPWRYSLTQQQLDTAALADLVGRDFTAPAPGMKLVGDITYIPTWQGWLYLATVLDCHTKQVVGYAMADHYRTPLIVEAIEMAATNGMIAPDAIFHSDRGSNYTSTEFAECLDGLDIQQSVGRTGICFDNAMAESFFGVLKVERVNRTVYPTRQRARDDIAQYIELWYNTRRLHSALGYRTPAEVYEDTLSVSLAA